MDVKQMSDVTSPLTVSMLAWWDPKDRTMLWNSYSLVPGILMVGADSIAFVTPDVTVFDYPLSEIEMFDITYLKIFSGSFRITRGDSTYRLYLLPPQGARKLSKDHLEGIGITLQATSAAGTLIGGSVVALTDLFGVLGDAIDAISGTASLVKTRRNYRLLHERITGSG